VIKKVDVRPIFSFIASFVIFLKKNFLILVFKIDNYMIEISAVGARDATASLQKLLWHN